MTCLLILASVVVHAATAQQASTVAPGAVVRWFDVPSGGRTIMGLVTAATPDTLSVLVTDGPAYKLAVASTRTLEIRGDQNSRGQKALVGAVIGAGFGGIVGLAAQNCWGCTSVGQTTLGGALWGVIIGALLTPSWKWHLLADPASGTVSVQPLLNWQYGPVLGLQIRH